MDGSNSQVLMYFIIKGSGTNFVAHVAFLLVFWEEKDAVEQQASRFFAVKESAANPELTDCTMGNFAF